MKKTFLLLLIAICTAINANAWRVGEEFGYGSGKNYYYCKVTKVPTATEPGLCEIVEAPQAPTSSDWNATIPAMVTSPITNGVCDYFIVSQVNESVFKGKKTLKTVSLACEKIAANAFQGCENLHTVRLATSVKTIDANAFAGCSSLKTVTCARELTPSTNYATNAFPKNAGMTLLLPRTVKDVMSKSYTAPAFSGFTYRRISSDCYDVVSSHGVKGIAINWDSKGWPTEVACVGYDPDRLDVIKGELTPNIDYCAIGKGAYMKCPVVAIADSAFLDNTELKKVNLEKLTALKTIGDGAFANCTVIESVVFPEGLETIGRGVFAGSSLKTIDIPASVKNINDQAFFDARYLERIFLKNTGKINGNLGYRFFGNNTENFQILVSAPNFKTIYDLAGEWLPTTVDRIEPKEKVRPFLYSETAGAFQDVAFGTWVDWKASGLQAFAVTAVDEANKKIFTTPVTNYKTKAGTGVLVTGFEAGKYYYLYGGDQTGNYYNGTSLLTGGPKTVQGQYYATYYPEINQFKWKDTPTKIEDYRTYLTKPDGSYFLYNDYAVEVKQGITGDVNGDSKVDVGDVNIIIDIILNNATLGNYPAADVNGDGKADVADVNLVIDIILGI